MGLNTLTHGHFDRNKKYKTRKEIQGTSEFSKILVKLRIVTSIRNGCVEDLRGECFGLGLEFVRKRKKKDFVDKARHGKAR